MALETSLAHLLNRPSTEALWELRADILNLSDQLMPERRRQAERTLEIMSRFHHYLADLQSKMTAHEYSRLASQMDMGSIGLLALQDLVTERERLLKKLFLGGLSEGLMVLATLQYSRAWQTEVTLVNEEARWWMFEGLWHVSRQLRPEVPAGERRTQIEALLAPLGAPDVAPPVKAAVLARLFQVLLVGSLDWCVALPREAER